MFKKIYSYIIMLTILVACNKNDDSAISGYIRTIDARNSNLKDDQLTMALLYSTDAGKTFVQFPYLKAGETYQVKVVDLNTGYVVKSADCFDLDWSASDPKPNKDNNGDVAEFTATGSNKVLVTIINHYTAFDAKIWPGVWTGDEGTVESDSVGVKIKSAAGAKDSNGLTADASNPNKMWLYKVRGVVTDKIYTIFNPSTKNEDQTIAVPSQVTAGGYTVSGSGTYDQCRKTFSLSLIAAFTDSTSHKPHRYQSSYSWTYTFTKDSGLPTYCAYNASSWLGAWIGNEVNPTGSTDPNNITADPSVPNRFHMDNFFGDGVDAYFDLWPSTSPFDQIIAFPKQTTSEGGILSATVGTYDQCSNTFNVDCSYKAFGSVYKWTYKFHK